MLKMFADIPGYKCNYGTIPAEIIVTSDRPDIVLVSEEQKVTLVELTVPFEMNIKSSHDYKVNKYAGLVSDIISQGYECQLLCIEVGSRGYISPDNRDGIKSLLKTVNPKSKSKDFKSCMNNLAKIAILTSYFIFLNKDEPEWSQTALVSISS